VIISNCFHTLYEFFEFIHHEEMLKWNVVGIRRNWYNVIGLDFISGFISNTSNLWRILDVVMDASWSLTKSMTKLTQCHGVWTSYRASYPTLRIYDEIWQFVMDAVWSMTKSENVMWISSWITRFFVVKLVELSDNTFTSTSFSWLGRLVVHYLFGHIVLFFFLSDSL
jgi:hypothetical protein